MKTLFDELDEMLGLPTSPEVSQAEIFVSANLKLGDRLLAMAEKMSDKINGCFADRPERTDKQRSQASHSRYDGHNLRATQEALTAVANGWRRGTLPVELSVYKSKKDVGEAVKVRFTRCSQGFHDLIYVDNGNFYDESATAVALRDFVWGEVDPRVLKLQEMEATLTNKLAEVRRIDAAGFFPTPDPVIDEYLLGFLQYSSVALTNERVLEPGAGVGSVADKVVEAGGLVTCMEIRPSLVEILKLKREIQAHNLTDESGKPLMGSGGMYQTVIDCDFLQQPVVPTFNYVLMNPPFENNVDIDHVQHAYRFLKPSNKDGVELRSIMGAGSCRRDAHKKKIRAFHEWLDSDRCGDYSWTELPSDAFKNAFRSTGVNCWMLSIDAM